MSRTRDVLNIFSKGKDVVYFKAHAIFRRVSETNT